MNNTNLKLQTLCKMELIEINGGDCQPKVIGDHLIENCDGTWTYTGGNQLVYAMVAVHNAAIYISDLFK